MEEKIIEKVDEKIEEILKSGINPANLDHLYKLTKIKCITKEEENMNYGNYSARGGYGAYGRENYGEYSQGGYGNYGEGSYGRRGRDSKYRGEEKIDKMYSDYGRYMEYRGRYGHNEDTDKSFYYMTKSLEEFVKYLFEEAETAQEKQMLKESLQKSMM